MKPAPRLPENKDPASDAQSDADGARTGGSERTSPTPSRDAHVDSRATSEAASGADAGRKSASAPTAQDVDKRRVRKAPADAGTEVEWAQTPLGKLIDQRERELVANVLPRLYNPVCVQVGWLGGTDLMGSTEAALKVLVADGAQASDEVTRVVASPTALPFGERSVDLALLVHALDFSAEPHQVLREVDQTLASDGHIVIVGFNPLSLWGLRRRIAWMFGRAVYRPFSGSWLRLSRVQDWLTLLGYETTAGARGVYTLPYQAPGLTRRFGFLERAGNRWWPRFGAVYVLVARKREITGAPVRGWRARGQALGRRLAVPVARTDGATSDKTSGRVIQWPRWGERNTVIKRTATAGEGRNGKTKDKH